MKPASNCRNTLLPQRWLLSLSSAPSACWMKQSPARSMSSPGTSMVMGLHLPRNNQLGQMAGARFSEDFLSTLKRAAVSSEVDQPGFRTSYVDSINDPLKVAQNVRDAGLHTFFDTAGGHHCLLRHSLPAYS